MPLSYWRLLYWEDAMTSSILIQNVTLDNEDYISEESEMYSGYIGIMTKMQAIGDKVIYLNELRGEMVVPTATGTH